MKMFSMIIKEQFIKLKPQATLGTACAKHYTEFTIQVVPFEDINRVGFI